MEQIYNEIRYLMFNKLCLRFFFFFLAAKIKMLSMQYYVHIKSSGKKSVLEI